MACRAASISAEHAHMRRAAPSTRRMRPLTRSLGAKCRRQRPVVVHAAEAEVATVEVDEWSARSEELSLLKVEGLKALLREYELKVSGQKAELVERLVTHERGLAAAAVAASVESVEAAAAVESVEIAAAVESIEAASAERANDSDAEVPPEATEGPQGEAVVIGAGPAGLACALMLRQKGYGPVRVFERLGAPPASHSEFYSAQAERSYNLGLSARGQEALKQFGAFDKVESLSARVVGRQDWDKEGKAKVTLQTAQKGYTTLCIQRDRLAAVLREVCAEDPGINVWYNVAAEKFKWDAEEGTVKLKTAPVECESSPYGASESDEETCDVLLWGDAEAGRQTLRPALLVGADGYRSTVRDAMVDAGLLTCTKFEDTNARRYKSIPLELDLDKSGTEWRGDLNFSARCAAGVVLEVLPTREGKGVGIALFKPGNAAIAEADTAEKAKAFFAEHFPMFREVIARDSYARFAAQREQRLPKFLYTGPELHATRTALIGDAIHTVKPYFGMGVNSAFDDVRVLGKCLDAARPPAAVTLAADAEAGAAQPKTTIDVQTALEAYSKRHAQDAKSLVTMSRSFDGGFLTFVLPIILDGIFSKLLPAVFSTNGIRMLQRTDITFSQAAAIKRRDRALQAVVLLTAAAAAARLAWLGLRWAANVLAPKVMALVGAA